MKLLEYEAKELLSEYQIKVPGSTLLKKGDHKANLPVVLKSQVPVGGRGKAGGIKIAKTTPQLQQVVNLLFDTPIKGHTPRVILAEELLAINRELYLSILVDKASATIKLMAHINGGVEVEENLAGSYLTAELDGHNFDTVGQQLADHFELADQTFVLQDMVENLYRCFVKNDALLIEINPLVYTTDKTLIAGDCKMTLDDNASFRHEWKFEDRPAEANFVTLNPSGTVATIANGAGLAMATVDAVHDFGMTPANFLDIGGGANAETLLTAFKRLNEYAHVKVIVINIFAGITRCDEVARAIIAARQQIDDLPPLFIRLAGTNFDEAAVLLEKEHIPILATLEDCLLAAKREVSS